MKQKINFMKKIVTILGFSVLLTGCSLGSSNKIETVESKDFPAIEEIEYPKDEYDHAYDDHSNNENAHHIDNSVDNNIPPKKQDEHQIDDEKPKPENQPPKKEDSSEDPVVNNKPSKKPEKPQDNNENSDDKPINNEIDLSQEQEAIKVHNDSGKSHTKGINKLKIGLHYIDLLPEENKLNYGDYQVIKNKKLFDPIVIASSRKYTSMRFGIVSKNPEKDMFNPFYQGVKTLDEDIPKTGKISYEGETLAQRENKVKAKKELSAWQKGKARVDIDFSNKTIDMNLTNFVIDNTQKITGVTDDLKRKRLLFIYNPNLQIDDIKKKSSFSKGRKNYQTDNGISFDFFGKNAEEIAGKYKLEQNDTIIKGVFGVKQAK